MKFNFNFIGVAPPALVAALPAPGYAEKYLSVEEAQALMFPGDALEAHTVSLTPEQVKAIEKDARVRVRDRDVRVWRAKGGGLFIVDQVLGKHELITWALALDQDGAVKQVEILEYRETYGSEIKNARWRGQFVGKRAGATLELDGDIKNISGATLSCRHITDGVKRLLATYEHALK
jgi:Na+-transporting NADH:ubiquinone oxidoreductase subunit NqrC